MGTGIVSVALHLDGEEMASRALLAIAASVWTVLLLVLAWRMWTDRRGVLAAACSPAGLAGIAGTAVLGTRVAGLGWTSVAAVLLVAAAAGWGLLTPAAYRRLSERVAGDAFMLTVASEGVAAVAAAIALSQRAAWLAVVAMLAAAVGAALYPFVLARFDLGDLRNGHGEHWVAGGSLAICALAAAEIAAAADSITELHAWFHLWRDIALALWVLAMLWLPILIASELRWPRWRYATNRWSTVFPLGMYSVCSFKVAFTSEVPAFADFARIWTWVAVAAWLAVSAGLVHYVLTRELRPGLATRA